MSDGTDILKFRDAQFAIVAQVPVRLQKRPLTGINDLEVAHGRIYANVMPLNDIYEISIETGQVLRLIDCGELVDRARRRDASRVLNGIAFVPQRNSFFITGKRWPMLFEVQWPE